MKKKRLKGVIKKPQPIFGNLFGSSFLRVLGSHDPVYNLNLF